MSFPDIPPSRDPPTDFVLRVMEKCKTGELVFPTSQFTVPVRPATVFQTRYKDARLLSSGGHSLVVAARIQVARPEFNLAAGDAIALRLSRVYTGRDKNSKYLTSRSLPDSTVMACYLAQLNSRYGSGVTDHYLELYGYFIVDDGVMFFDGIDNWLKKGWEHEEWGVEEMELVDGDWASLSRNIFMKTDGLFLEAVIGEWAANAYLGVSVQDEKYKNEGFKNVSYYRRYRMGEHTFTFPPGPMPVRLDLDSTIYQKTRQEGSRAIANNTGRFSFMQKDPNAHRLSRIFSNEADFNNFSNIVKRVGISMLKKEAGLFRAMVLYAPQYVDQPAPTDAPVKRYRLDIQKMWLWNRTPAM